MIRTAFFFLLLNCLNALSVTEVTEYYPEFCPRAAKDEETFKRFRSDTAMQRMVENVTYEQGLQMLEVIEQKYPHLLSEISQICADDHFGEPAAYEYPKIGRICPTTLRYVKIAGDLRREFGDLKNFRIFEIGGGYGGQCKILHDLFGFKSYTLIDLPECLPLVSRYLDHFHVPHIRYLSNTKLSKAREYDLFISNYAFSEIGEQEQREYLEKVVSLIPRGYITYNYVSSYYGVDSLTVDEVVSLLTKEGRIIKVESENPVTGAGNVVVTWYPIEGVASHLRKIEDKSRYQKEIDEIDYVYLINLDKRPEKLQRSLAQLKNYGISPCRFPAIYGWVLPEKVFHDVGLKFLPGMSFVNNGWNEHSDVSFMPGRGERKRLDASSYETTCFHAGLSPGAVGCTLSHLSVLKDAYDSNYQLIWVLEDDFVIQGDPHQLSDIVKKLDTLVGRDGWDVLYTDQKCGFNVFEDSHDCWRPEMPTFDQYALLKQVDIDENFCKIGARARTHSMLITRSGIKKILDFEVNHGIFNPYDADIAFVPGINLYCLKHDLITWSYDGSDTTSQNF